MIVYDMATKGLGTELFLQHNIADLISGMTFIVLFSQKSLYGERKSTHTRIHTHTKNQMYLDDVYTPRLQIIEKYGFWLKN